MMILKSIAIIAMALFLVFILISVAIVTAVLFAEIVDEENKTEEEKQK